MKKYKDEIISHKDEIESLNDIVELDIENLEAIVGGGCGQLANCPSLRCIDKCWKDSSFTATANTPL